MRWMTWRAISGRPLAKVLRQQRAWARQMARQSSDPVKDFRGRTTEEVRMELEASGDDPLVGTPERHGTNPKP
jgi:hypothetical protein